MTPRQLAVVLLRVYAITLVVDVVQIVFGGVWSFAGDLPEGEGRRWAAYQAAAAVAYGGMALYLLLRTHPLAARVCSGVDGHEARAEMSATLLAAVGFSVVGLYLLVNGLSGVLGHCVGWHFARSERFFADARWLAISAFQSVLGLGLFLA
ncbi:MAG: hypothetical protein ACREID_09530, partial [Planctomycetota bacterium]